MSLGQKSFSFSRGGGMSERPLMSAGQRKTLPLSPAPVAARGPRPGGFSFSTLPTIIRQKRSATPKLQQSFDSLTTFPRTKGGGAEKPATLPQLCELFSFAPAKERATKKPQLQTSAILLLSNDSFTLAPLVLAFPSPHPP
jgi:hypothetical protein